MATLLHRWEGLPRVAAVWCGPVLELWYWPTQQVWDELEELIAAEQKLTPILAWSLHREGECPIVRIESSTGRPEHLEPIAFLVGAQPGRAVGRRRRCRVWTSPN